MTDAEYHRQVVVIGEFLFNKGWRKLDGNKWYYPTGGRILFYQAYFCLGTALKMAIAGIDPNYSPEPPKHEGPGGPNRRPPGKRMVA